MEDQVPHTPFANDLASRSGAAIRELQARAQAALVARREQMSRLEQDIDQQLNALDEALAVERSADLSASDETAQAHSEIARLRDELTLAQAAWQQQREAEAERISATQQQLNEREIQLTEQEKTSQQRDEELCQREKSLAERASELTNREQLHERAQSEQQHAVQSLADSELAWAAERRALELARNELADKLEGLTAQHRTAGDDWKRQIDDIEQRLQEQQAAWERQRVELERARGVVEQERDKLAHELLASRDKLRAAEELAAAAGERDELKQKFELALADVQRFRASVAELEQELSRRPAAGGADSAELTHLRAERDALAARVDTLEQQAASPVDTDDAQQIADLQRRFEMAVEDVRELKTKNAELESRLASSRKQSFGSDDGGNMDWESQKRRLLASLEGEHGEIEPAREEERATIQHTIDMTDAVVAQKDREIDEIKARVASDSDAAHDAHLSESDPIETLADADEIIAQRREHAAQLEKELEEKLRAAELELSIERAKLAREKAEVEEWRLEMETFRKTRAADEPALVAGTPRRRWLAKLGLNGEEKG